MDEKYGRTNLCSQAHTDLTQHIDHLLPPDGLSSASTYRLCHHMTSMDGQGVQLIVYDINSTRGVCAIRNVSKIKIKISLRIVQKDIN